jgi:hypothetical protein
MPGKDKILVAAWRVSSVCLFSALLQSSIQGPWSLWLFTPSSCINPNLSFHQLTTTQTRSSHTHSKEQIQCIATAPWHHISQGTSSTGTEIEACWWRNAAVHLGAYTTRLGSNRGGCLA